MKDIGIGLGAFGKAAFIWVDFQGTPHDFEWWEWILVTIYFCVQMAIWGALVWALSAAFKEAIVKLKEQWTGKKKDLKPVT